MKKLLILLIGILFVSCATTKDIEKVYIHQTDTIYQNQIQKDSIYLRDSIYVVTKNDTVFLSKYSTKYVEKLKVDTLYKNSNDTTIVYQEKVKEVKYTPAIYKWSLGILIALIVGILVYTGIKLYLKFKP